jgi:hypothetical protein
MAMTKTASGLQYEDTQAGEGGTATRGQTCVIALHRMALDQRGQGQEVRQLT